MSSHNVPGLDGGLGHQDHRGGGSQLFANFHTLQLTEPWDVSISLYPLFAWEEAEEVTAPPGKDAETEAQRLQDLPQVPGFCNFPSRSCP